jgi:hypothetical protein
MQPHGDRSNALDGAAAALTVTAHSDAVWQCHCHGTVMVLVSSASGPRVSASERRAAAPAFAHRGTAVLSPRYPVSAIRYLAIDRKY